MSKQSPNKGYILFESLVALLITAVVVMFFLSQVVFIMQSEKKLLEKLYPYRSLYEETAAYSRLRKESNSVSRDGYVYTFSEKDEILVRVEVNTGKETLVVERKTK